MNNHTDKKLKIIVIGDLMLDEYIEGNVNRISPEAPVQIVSKENEYCRLGGAANVIANLNNLKCEVYPIGLIGNDPNGAKLKKLFKLNKIRTDGLIIDKQKSTTTKLRVIANKHQLLRIDTETLDDLNKITSNKVIMKFKKYLKYKPDGVILQDYNKGLLEVNLTKAIIKLCNKNKIFVAVDPKLKNISKFNNCNLFKPNRIEAEYISGFKITSELDLKKVAIQIFKIIKTNYLLITLAEDGMALFDQNLKMNRIKSNVKNISDVSGAGDTVISVLTYQYLRTNDIGCAISLANKAAGVVISQPGVVPIKLSDLES